MDSKLLKLDELAEALSVEKKTIQRLMKTGAIPFLRVSERIVRFDVNEVVEALKARQHGNAA